jgi:O-antigen/teichoic acid export membrane protein
MIVTRPPGLIKNYLFLSGGELLSKVVTFAAIAYLARIAGPAGFGLVEFAGAVLLCAGLVVDQGFGLYGAREIAKDPQRTDSLAREVITARTILALLAYMGVIGFALLLNRSLLVTQMLLVYGLSLVGLPFMLTWVFQGHQQMKTVAVIQIIRQAVYAGVIFIFVRSATQILFAGVAELAGVVAAALYSIWIYRSRYQVRGLRASHLHPNWQSRFKISKQLFQEGVPIGLSQIFWTMRMFGATVLLGIIAQPEEVGYFSSAMRIQIALHSFIFLYFFNLLPSLSQAWLRKDESFKRLEDHSLQLVAWLAMVGGLTAVLVMPVIIRGVYGIEFSLAVIVMQILVGVLIFAALSGHYRFGLVAAGHQKAEMGTSALGAVVALVAVPIGYFWQGITGAAIGLVIAECVVWLTTWVWSKLTLGLDGHLRLLIRPAAAGLVCTACAIWLPVSSTWVRLTLVLVLFTGLAVILEPAARKSVCQTIKSYLSTKHKKSSFTIL